jgi:membrane-bound ClpP family serine protease
MIIMPIIMVSPLLALLLFYYLPFKTALPIYGVILIISGFCYYVMFKSMRMEAKTGMEARIGREALVIEDIDPEGKTELKEEIWTATARGKRIPQGKRVRIRDARGLVLIVESLDEEEK